MRKLLILIPLVGLLAVSVWFAIYAWTALDGPPIPIEGKVAMGLGIFFSLVVGIGLMALVFYSSRYGYDEAAHYDSADRTPR
jgi:formate hydrogenlyase subunit 3/multisubunit Na+/H+ antiporter MnhD subunit